jgi:Rieske Fe-S protein
MTEQPRPDQDTTRRGVVLGVGMVGLAGALAACGGSSKGANSYAGTPPPADPAMPPSSAPAKSTTTAAMAIGRVGQVPVGGGMVFSKHKVVVTQPKKGEFRAFSAICTHMGCTVDKVAHGTIDCPCHGSKYSIADAKVVAGPAPRPLPGKKVKIKGGKIWVA